MNIIKKKELNIKYEKKGIIFEINSVVLDHNGSIEVELFIGDERRFASLQDGNILTFWDIKVGKQKINGLKIEDQSIWDRIINAVSSLKKEFEKMKQEDLVYIPETVEVAEGEESARIYVFVNTPNGVEKPILVQDLEKEIQGLRHKIDIYDLLNELEKEGYAKRITDTGHFLALWDYEVDLSKLISKVHEAWEEKIGKKSREEKERRERLLKLAQETGKPQEIYSYTDSCDDPNLDCSVDIVTAYIYPDGKIKEERTHTF